VEARSEFYEGRKALIAAEFQSAADHYGKGLKLWEGVQSRHPAFEKDDETRKESKRVIRRYLLSIRQSGNKEPADYPLKKLMKGPQEDIPPDPFDQLEMLRTSTATTSPASKPAAR